MEAPAETAAPETEAPTEAAEWHKTIVDVVGNEITLEGPATRLVGTHNPTMNMAVILGGGKYIAGFGNKEMADVLYSYDELMADINGLYELLYGQTFTAEQIGISE